MTAPPSNANEACRTSIRLQEQALKLGDTMSFRAEWRAFQRVFVVHAAIEDRTLSALLAGVVSRMRKRLSRR